MIFNNWEITSLKKNEYLLNMKRFKEFINPIMMDNQSNQYRNPILIFALFLAIFLGTGIGYLIFSPSQNADNGKDTVHAHETGLNQSWTCSMHPQIRQREPGDCPICGMDLIPMEKATSSDPLVLEMTPEAVKLAQIETTVIGEGINTDEIILKLSGKIQEDERLIASQVAHIPGRIEQLYVSFRGEEVQKGQKIARIYSPELITAQQELIQALKLKDSRPGLYQAARQKLTYWKLTETQISQMAKQGKIQENFDVYADASGVVATRKISVGDYVQQGEVLFDLVDLNKVWVLFDAYEEDLIHINLGDEIRFTTPSIPDKSFTTRVAFIDPVIDPETRVAAVRGEIANPGRSLKPEMLVQGELIAPASKAYRLMAPASAVLWTGKRSVVYVKEPDVSVPSFRYQEVVLGERVGDSYYIQEGLQAGDEVVTYGSFTIDAAAQLNNQRSMMNPWVSLREEPVNDMIKPLEVAQEFRSQLYSLTETYIKLKDALVATDAHAASEEARDFQEQLNQLRESELERQTQSYWANQKAVLDKYANTIVTSGEIDAQRESFQMLSDHLIQTVQSMGVSGGDLYIQHCPMADDYKGADWISMEAEIRNPYFGDEMLTCGSVTGEIPGEK